MEVLVGSVNLTTPGLSILRTRALLLYFRIFSLGGGTLLYLGKRLPAKACTTIHKRARLDLDARRSMPFSGYMRQKHHGSSCYSITTRTLQCI